MYNKIFTKILDSSIWLETDATRIVWLTFIAAMDENGFTQFACPANVASRARVTLEAAEIAIKILESPDKNSGDPDHEGRRIEKVPGGWIVLNAAKYREIVTRAIGQEKTRERVARFREARRVLQVTPVTKCNDTVTKANESVTQSDTDTEADTETPIVPLAGDNENKLRISTLFRRRQTTPWDKSELKAYGANRKAIEATTSDEWALLSRFYALPYEGTYRRKNIATLLNNWNAEIQRAQAHFATPANGRQPSKYVAMLDQIPGLEEPPSAQPTQSQ